MVYEKVFPKCSYRGKGNSKCSHKGCGGKCPYNKPEKCDMYIDWLKLTKDDDDGLNQVSELNLQRSEDD